MISIQIQLLYNNQYKKITTFLEKYNIHDIITCVTKKKGNIINIMIIG